MKRILIVEDSATQAERLKIILEAGGFDAEIAIDGEGALARMATTPFDLVISDIVMPGLSGYELCRAIKSAPAWDHIPVILLTTRRDPMDIFNGLQCGADNFFTKPYDADRLTERVRNILYNRSLRSSGKLKLGVEIAFFGKVVTINSEKEQILDLLVSAFEDIVQTNRDLESAKTDLSKANGKIEDYARLLEGKVWSSERQYRAIVDGISEGIVTVDQAGTMGSVNPAAETVFGYGADEMVGQSFKMLLSAPDHAQYDDYFAACQRAGGRKNGDGRARLLDGRRKNGTAFPMSLLLSEVDSGEHRMFVCVIRDLTLEKQVEEQTRQAQKMEALGQLTGGLAHDFNNLLTVILGNSELLAEQLPPDGQHRKLAQMAKEAAERGAALTSRLLAFSRQQPLDPKPIDVNRLITNMDGLLRRTLGGNVEIEMIRHGGLWMTLVDAPQLDSALLNLCINARDAMATGGRLTIETANVHLDQEYAGKHIEVTPGQYVMVAVSDTGTGMPPEVIARVFDPFFTTKKDGKGSGLGLSMIYGFVKQSQGHVDIYSELGQGTTVKLYLPRAAATAEKAEPRRTEAAIEGGAEKILLVEDDDLVRKHVLAQLEALGYRVVAVRSGPDAIDALRSRTDFDLLFTDIVIPGGMNGKQLADEARKLHPDLPVLFTSGYTENAILHHGRLNPGVYLLNKPYRLNGLAAKVRMVLNLKSAEQYG
jgi:PAS domain S-box-containing protein